MFLTIALKAHQLRSNMRNFPGHPVSHCAVGNHALLHGGHESLRKHDQSQEKNRCQSSGMEGYISGYTVNALQTDCLSLEGIIQCYCRPHRQTLSVVKLCFQLFPSSQNHKTKMICPDSMHSSQKYQRTKEGDLRAQKTKWKSSSKSQKLKRQGSLSAVACRTESIPYKVLIDIN